MANQCWGDNTFFMRAKDINFSGEEIGKIKVVRLIGQGNWADVYLAEHVDTMEKLAVKTTSKKKFSEVPKLKELVQAEINILKSCKNPNVVRLVDSFLHKDHQFIVLEYCNGLQLGDVLGKEKKIDEITAISYLKQILNGFKGLHEVQAMHRDFKVENVMLHDGICKIVDLGFGRQLMAEGEVAKTKLGSNLTMAPEVMQGLPYDFRVDIWSIGVVYYQMLYGTFPFQARSAKALLQQTRRHQFSLQGQDISQNSKDFIKRCLMFNPEQRINWTEIYHHHLIVDKNQEINFGPESSQFNVEQNASFYENFLRSLKKSAAIPTQLDLKRSSILLQLRQTSQLRYPMFQSADVKRIEGLKYVPQLDFQQKKKQQEQVQVFSFGESKFFECQQEKKEEIRTQKIIKEVRYLYLRRIQDIKFMPNFLKKQMTLFINKKLIAKILFALCLMQKQSSLQLSQLKDDLMFMKNSFNIKQQQFELFFKNDNSIVYEVDQHQESANNLSQVFLANLQKIDHQRYLDIKQKIEQQEIKPQKWSQFFNRSINTLIQQINTLINNTKQTEDYNRLLKLSFFICQYAKLSKSSEFDKRILISTLRRYNNGTAANSQFQIAKQSQSNGNKQQSFKKQGVKKSNSPTTGFFSSAFSCS